MNYFVNKKRTSYQSQTGYQSSITLKIIRI